MGLFYPAGPKAGDYTYREGLEHKCKRDILLGRLKNSEDKTWKRIRPRPTKTNFVGSYYLCKGDLEGIVLSVAGKGLYSACQGRLGGDFQLVSLAIFGVFLSHQQPMDWEARYNERQ